MFSFKHIASLRCALFLAVPLALNMSSVFAAADEAKKNAGAAEEASDLAGVDELPSEELEQMLEELGDEISKPVIRYCNLEIMVTTPAFTEIGELSSTLEVRLKARADKITMDRQRLEKDQADLAKQEAALGGAARSEKMNELQMRAATLYEEMQRFQQEMQMETGNIYKRAAELASEEVKAFCQDEKKYDIVIPTPFPCNTEYDITQEIIDSVNAKYAEKKKKEKASKGAVPAVKASASAGAKAAAKK